MQGLILAAGQVLGGHPVVGVWISTALGCAAILDAAGMAASLVGGSGRLACSVAPAHSPSVEPELLGWVSGGHRWGSSFQHVGPADYARATHARCTADGCGLGDPGKQPAVLRACL